MGMMVQLSIESERFTRAYTPRYCLLRMDIFEQIVKNLHVPLGKARDSIHITLDDQGDSSV